MSHTHPSLQSRNRRRVKDIPDHTVRLDLVETPARPAGNDTGRILTTVYQSRTLISRREVGLPMLQQGQTLSAANQCLIL